jgi:plasmid replication initiation protein
MLINSSTTGFLPNEILNASYNYSAHEIEVLLAVVDYYRGENCFTMNTDSLTRGFGKTNALNKELKNAIRGIIEKPLEYWNAERKVMLISSVITSAEIDTNRREVRFTVNETMGKILTHAKEKYSRYNFEVMLNLNSRYSKRLYLHCNAWRKTGVWEIKLDKLRKMLGVADKYEQFYDFNTKILQPAFSEINEKSEYVTVIDYLKNGKSYSSMLVSVTLKKEFVKTSQRQWAALKSFGLADWQIKNVTASLSDYEIEKHLNHIKMNRHQIKNVGGWLVNTFKAIGVPLDKKLYVDEKPENPAF